MVVTQLLGFSDAGLERASTFLIQDGGLKMIKMSWVNVDDKHKKRFIRNFVLCENPHEKQYIVEIIMEEFPSLKRERVKEAVSHSCHTVTPPRNRKVFLDHVSKKISEV